MVSSGVSNPDATILKVAGKAWLSDASILERFSSTDQKWQGDLRDKDTMDTERVNEVRLDKIRREGRKY